MACLDLVSDFTQRLDLPPNYLHTAMQAMWPQACSPGRLIGLPRNQRSSQRTLRHYPAVIATIVLYSLKPVLLVVLASQMMRFRRNKRNVVLVRCNWSTTHCVTCVITGWCRIVPVDLHPFFIAISVCSMRFLHWNTVTETYLGLGKSFIYNISITYLVKITGEELRFCVPLSIPRSRFCYFQENPIHLPTYMYAYPCDLHMYTYIGTPIIGPPPQMQTSTVSLTLTQVPIHRFLQYFSTLNSRHHSVRYMYNRGAHYPDYK